MKTKNAKKKTVQVSGALPARLPAAKSAHGKKKYVTGSSSVKSSLPDDFAEVVKRAKAQAEEIMNDPILKLQRSRIVNVAGIDPEWVCSYLLAKDLINQAQVDDLSYAMLVLVMSHKISCAFQGPTLRFPELGKGLFNSDSSEIATPSEVLKLPEGLCYSSPIYFEYELGTSTVKNGISTGDFLIISTGGMYRWVYSCSARHRKNTWWRDAPKCITGTKEFVVTESSFEPVGIDGMFSLIFHKRIEPLAFLYQLRDKLISMDHEVSRVHGNIKSTLEFAHHLLGRIYRTS